MPTGIVFCMSAGWSLRRASNFYTKLSHHCTICISNVLKKHIKHAYQNQSGRPYWCQGRGGVCVLWMLLIIRIIFTPSLVFHLFCCYTLKWRGATRDFTFMFWIIANDCACLIILSVPEYIINKLKYGILHQLPAISGHIESKQQTFTLILLKSAPQNT